MNRFTTTMKLLAFLCLAAVPALAQEGDDYDVYKDGIPDVDKNPFPPVTGDDSCWQATASNMLGAAGWGLPTNSAQQNAEAIYGQMNDHFTKNYAGDTALAVTWWLYNYGYNPNEMGNGWYRPELNYNDVTRYSGSITLGSATHQYDWLLNQLNSCQYIGLSIVHSNNDHAITLVGGDYSDKTGGKSVFHDSDRNQNDPPPSDDEYTNQFDVSGWTLAEYPAGVTGYTMLCPGLQKPASAMENYDAAYYRNQRTDGTVFKTWRIAGDKADDFGTPHWEQEDEWDPSDVLIIQNEEVPDYYKIVHLLVNFRDVELYDETNAPDILLSALGDEGEEVNYDPVIDVSAGGGQVLYTWELPNQPPFEKIIFPNYDFYNLSGDVMSFNIATECVPEPATMALLAIGGLALIRRRKR